MVCKSILYSIKDLTYVRDYYYFYYKWTYFTFDVTNLKALCIRKLLMYHIKISIKCLAFSFSMFGNWHIIIIRLKE